jgi:SAM-dependent methyltransferase
MSPTVQAWWHALGRRRRGSKADAPRYAGAVLKRLRPAAVATLRRFTYLVPPSLSRRVKRRAEIFFWKAELERYRRWYDGEPLYGMDPPGPQERVAGYSRETNATMTFLRVYQFQRYRDALQLGPDALAGLRVLDVGCGPFANLLAFCDAERHGLDPLVDRYRAAGYPLEEWTREGFTYHQAHAEHMPFPDGHFDVVLSVNAIDHVDALGAVATEIRRVLRPGGRLRLQVNYHPPTVTEPVHIDDDIMRRHFGWASELHKVRDEPHPFEEGERLTLWVSEHA